MKTLRNLNAHVQGSIGGPMVHISEKVKVSMLLLLCGPDREDIYEGFNLDERQQYDLDLIWALFDRH